MCYVVAAAEDEGFNLEIGQAIRNHFAGHGLKAPLLALALGSAGGIGQGENTVFFSRRQQIYSERVLIHEETDAMAMAVNLAYAGGGDGRGLWHDLPPAKQESSRAAADFIPTMLHLAGISAGEATDAALFKGRLVENAPLLENLARTEHLCWNAFHYAMGYTLMPLEEVEGRAQQGITPVQKDMAALRHAGLVGWDELDALSQRLGALMMRSTLDYKQMDRANVVQIPRTLAIHRLLDEKSGLEAR